MGLSALWWWIDRWRKSSAFMHMTLEEQGAYRNLLDEAALRGGPLPNDQRILAKASGDATRWHKVKAEIMRHFDLKPDGFWHNETLDKVLVESARRAAKQKRYRQGKQAPYVTAIVARDGCICGICASAIELEVAEIDHIIPIAVGGHISDVRNLQLAHATCNQKKGVKGRQRHDSLLSRTVGLRHDQRNYQSHDQSNDQASPSPSPSLSLKKKKSRNSVCPHMPTCATRHGCIQLSLEEGRKEKAAQS